MSRIILTLEAFADDGENLTPLNIQQVVVPYADWSKFDLGEAVAEVQAQLDAAETSADLAALGQAPVSPPPNREARRAAAKKNGRAPARI